MSINVNGQEYGSWDEVPPELRALFAALPDADRDGTPDILQGGTGTNAFTNVTTVTTTSYTVDGTQYGSLEEMPDALRRQVGDLLGALDTPAPGGAAEPPARPEPAPRTGRGPRGNVHQVEGTRPTVISGERYIPEASTKRWWQFWK